MARLLHVEGQISYQRFLVAFDVVEYKGKKDVRNSINAILADWYVPAHLAEKRLNTTWLIWSEKSGATAVANAIMRQIEATLGKRFTADHVRLVVTQAGIKRSEAALVYAPELA